MTAKTKSGIKIDYTIKRSGIVTYRRGGIATRKIGTCPVCGRRGDVPLYRYLNDNGNTETLASTTHAVVDSSAAGFAMREITDSCHWKSEHIAALPLFPGEVERVKARMRKRIEDKRTAAARLIKEADELQAKLETM